MATVELWRKLSCWCSIAVPPYRRAFLWLHSGWRRYEALEYLHFISWVYRFVVFVCGDMLSIALSLGMAWLLLARTEWLADKLKIRDEGGVEGVEKYPLMLIGVKLIGLYVAILCHDRGWCRHAQRLQECGG